MTEHRNGEPNVADRAEQPDAAGEDGSDARSSSDAAASDLPTGLAKPAQRALAAAGYVRLEEFTTLNEADVLQLHGMGPKALDLIRRALAARGQSFANSPRGTR